MTAQTSYERVLFFASGRGQIASQVYGSLLRRFPDAALEVVATDEFARAIPIGRRGSIVLTAGQHRGRLRFMLHARQAPYTAVVVLLTGEPGYLTMKVAGLAVGLRRWLICYNENGDSFEVDRDHVAVIRRHLAARRPSKEFRGRAGDTLLRMLYALLQWPGQLWMLGRCLRRSLASARGVRHGARHVPAASYRASAGRRVLFLCPYVPAMGIAAGNARMYRIIEAAAQQHEVTLLTYYESDSEQEHLDKLRRICTRVEAVRRGQSLGDWKRDPLRRVPEAISNEFGNTRMRELVYTELAKGQHEILQVEYVLSMYLVPRDVPIPIVLTHHELMHRALAGRIRASGGLFDRLQLLPAWVRALSFETEATERATVNVFMTEEEAAAMARWVPGVNSVVNHTGVDCDYFSPSEGPVIADSLVYMGYFKHQPNVDAVLYFCHEVLPLIWTRRSQTRFTIVGGFPPPEVSELEADPRITVTGWVADYRPYIASATAFVVPVVSGAGIRGKVTEAWSMAKPVISTPLGVEGLRAVDGGNAAIANNPVTFAEKVVQILADPDFASELGAAGLKTARQFYDWRVTTAAHARIYEDACVRFRQPAA